MVKNCLVCVLLLFSFGLGIVLATCTSPERRLQECFDVRAASMGVRHDSTLVNVADTSAVVGGYMLRHAV